MLYRKWGAGPFRLWDPNEGIDVLFTGEQRFARPRRTRSARSPATRSTGCGTDEHARRMVAGIAWVLGQPGTGSTFEARLDEPPQAARRRVGLGLQLLLDRRCRRAPRPLAAKLDLAFPGRWQSRTMTRAVVTVAPGAAGQARLGESRSYNLLLNGEVLANGELFDSFRYKFDLPAARRRRRRSP